MEGIDTITERGGEDRWGGGEENEEKWMEVLEADGSAELDEPVSEEKRKSLWPVWITLGLIFLKES